MSRRIALSMARTAAIRPGTSLSEQEMEAIMSDLLKLASPDYTPDGRLIISIISADDIARPFQ
ncbi:MAG: hypothetical protein K2J18_02885 [Paramuribaculum sp.]|nr:hypothetical protein [Paramuribaculum sp.]